jgi:hypothetical protein
MNKTTEIIAISIGALIAVGGIYWGYSQTTQDPWKKEYMNMIENNDLKLTRPPINPNMYDDPNEPEIDRRVYNGEGGRSKRRKKYKNKSKRKHLK